MSGWQKSALDYHQKPYLSFPKLGNRNWYLLPGCCQQEHFIALQWDGMWGRPCQSDLPSCPNSVILSFIRCFTEERGQGSDWQIVSKNTRAVAGHSLCLVNACGKRGKYLKFCILNVYKHGVSEREWWICGHRKGLINQDLFSIFYIKHQRIEKIAPPGSNRGIGYGRGCFLKPLKPNSEIPCFSKIEKLQRLQ